jgi:hypothetical protein
MVVHGRNFAAALCLVVLGVVTSSPVSALNTSVPQGTIKSTWLAADGSLVSFLGGRGGMPASAGLGIMHYAPAKIDTADTVSTRSEQFSIFLAVAGTSDTVSGAARDFGTSLVSSSVTGHRPSLQMDYASFHNYGPERQTVSSQQVGWRVYAGIGEPVWTVQSSNGAKSSAVVEVAGGCRAMWVPIRQLADSAVVKSSQGTAYISLTLELGLTGRYLYFDGENGDEVRALALNGEKRALGGEGGVTLQIGDLIASMYLPMFVRQTNGANMLGLQGAHPQFQLSIQTKFLKISR